MKNLSAEKPDIIQKAPKKNGDQMKFIHLIYIGISVLLLLLISTQIQAAPLDSAGLLDNILDRYSTVASTWATTIENYATWLYWTLALISMVWTFGIMAMQGEGLSGALAEVVRFFVTIGFFFYLLKNGPAISVSIQDSLRQLAANASGLSKSFSPSGMVDIGFDIVSQVIDQSSIWSPTDFVVGLILAGIILGVLALIGVNMLLILITGWILSYCGIFLLGFGGARWTSDIAINYFRTVLGVSLQLFTMVLIVGIGRSFIDLYAHDMAEGTIQMKSMFVMFVASLVLLSLVNKIPPMIASIVGGASMQGIGSFGARDLANAAAAAAAIATTVGALAAAGAANAAGGASALKAAFESAQDAMAEESGARGSSGDGMGGSGQDTGNIDASGDSMGSGGSGENSGSSSAGGAGSASRLGGGSKGFAQSFSRAGRMAGHMANSLAEGMVSRNAANHESKMASARSTITQTPGGQLAAQIRSQTASRHSSPMGSDGNALQGAFANNNSNATGADFAGYSLSGNEQVQSNRNDTGPVNEQGQDNGTDTGQVDTQNPQNEDKKSF